MTLYDLTLPTAGRGRWSRPPWRRLTAVALAAGLAASAVAWELRTFRGEAWLLSRLAAELDVDLASGPAPALVLERPGPYDQRLGYARLPEVLDRLEGDGWEVVRQARLTPLHRRWVDWGMKPIYREKTQAGLVILDAAGDRFYASPYPERIYTDFAQVPPVVARSLTFIENRELLDPVHPFRNPAVEWDRLATALVGRGLRWARPGGRGHGGSTLATQLEKSRHSPGGRTGTGGEKLRQIATASLRAYRDGPLTEATRRDTLVSYLNELPLAAMPGYGEVQGLGDGLWAWYGADFGRTNELLAPVDRLAEGDDADLAAERAAAYRRVLSLLLAQRRPAYYLDEDLRALDRLTDRYLDLLLEAGVIPPALATSAAEPRRRAAPARERSPLHGRKGDLAVRRRLARMLGLDRLYDLDRSDLTAVTTLDGAAQRAVSAALVGLADPAGARGAGVAPLLGGGDPAGVLYSFTLYERTAGTNRVRVQVDSGDRPLDLNDGAKLELGSTAKLRTLVTYLELVAELHQRYAGLPRTELATRLEQAGGGAPDGARPDRITRFVLEQLLESPDAGLDAVLEAAMTRRYSASPAESFFTGGGVHRFRNFDAADDGRVLTVREAFQRSVNLVFIRLMRDLVEHYRAELPGSAAGILDDPHHPLRAQYLERFAEREGAEFVRRFYREHAGRSTDESLRELAAVRPTPKRLAALHRSVRPDASFEQLDRFLRQQLDERAPGERDARRLYEQLSPTRLGLADRGYVARVHPLELWLLQFLDTTPGASLAGALDASADARRDAYAWLYRPGHRKAQDRRIRTLLETEAFAEIHRAWQRVGYPFDSLVPSYATAIGSSADRPAALAELLGILLADGIRQPTERLTRLHLAAGTPYEAELVPAPRAGVRVLHSAVAAVARRELVGVVQKGTAARAQKTVESAGGSLEVGGKTGTGDNRTKGGRSGSSTGVVHSRTASFVFTVGDRFYGTVVVYVPGPAASDYSFTSSAAVQVWNRLLPALEPVFARPPVASTPAELRQAATAIGAAPAL